MQLSSNCPLSAIIHRQTIGLTMLNYANIDTMTAPDFALPDQDSKTHRLSDYRGKWLVVYFYPQDDTPECTIQACDFRDQSAQLRKRDLAVLRVSADSIASHKEFAKK